MCKLVMLLTLSLPALSAASWAGQPIRNSTALKAVFADPPPEYSSAPLWVWNDDLTEEQVASTLRDLAGQNVKQAFVHPRPGLMTPYLSHAWLRLWKVALVEARRLGMNLWIYDENSYPSGFAGGFVPDAMPEARGRGLGMREETSAPAWSDDFIAVFKISGERYEDVSTKINAGDNLPDGTYLVFTLLRAGDSPWTGGKCYVDLMYPGVTEKFIEVTLEAYKRELGDEFGRLIPGTFTDEPHTSPAGGLPWTEHLPAVFENRWGYDLRKHLPSLWRKVGDWKRVRHNYYQVVLEQFIEHWARPLHDWCEQNRLEFTGHYWEHEWPRTRVGPDNMAIYAWHQRPAIDILMNQYSEDVHAQFGNVRAVKELASVANQLGLRRTLCEAYGAAGWDSRLEDYKRIGDWLYVLGVNTLDQHLSYVSLRGARKRDHPQSFSYHEPWWEAYGAQGLYFARLSAALSAGEEINHLLVIEPTTTAWMYNTDAPDDPQLTMIGAGFQKFVADLMKRQIEFDIGCEDIIARHGSVDGDELKVGARSYSLVLLPPLCENLNAPTVQVLEEAKHNGLHILACGHTPALVDGQPSDRLRDLIDADAWDCVAGGPLPERIAQLRDVDVIVRCDADDRGMLHHQRRRLDDGQLLFLVNTSDTFPTMGSILAPGGYVDEWDVETGEISPYPAQAVKAGTTTSFILPPCGSLLLYFSDPNQAPLDARPNTGVSTFSKAMDRVGCVGRRSAVGQVGSPEIHRVAPNVLTLDYVDVTAGGETKTNLYFYQAGQFVWQKHGFERNPWDSAVQFRDELILRTFPPDSGFEATYRFVIAERVPADLAIVIERSDLYAVTCNGQPVSATPGEWWLDKQFGKIALAGAARVGENAVTIKASPMTMYHELESAYVLGDFTLKPTDKGFVIAPPEPLKLGKWNEHGQPFYAAGVTYVEKFEASATSAAEPDRYLVSLPAWYGAVAKVAVNGEAAGYIAAPPYECDVSRRIVAGTNTIDVTVIGTLKNTLGPHHGKPALGMAWPGMFQNGPNPGPPPGSEYSTVGYGLFAPFALLHVDR